MLGVVVALRMLAIPRVRRAPVDTNGYCTEAPPPEGGTRLPGGEAGPRSHVTIFGLNAPPQFPLRFWGLNSIVAVVGVFDPRRKPRLRFMFPGEQPPPNKMMKRRRADADQTWPEERVNMEHGLYTLHNMFRLVGTHLTHRDVRVFSFLFVDVIGDDQRGEIKDGRDFFLTLERQGRCDENNFRQVLQLLRIITRHDLLPYVTLKRRESVIPDPVDKYLEETSMTFIKSRTSGTSGQETGKTASAKNLCYSPTGPQMSQYRPGRLCPQRTSRRKRKRAPISENKEKQTCGQSLRISFSHFNSSPGCSRPVSLPRPLSLARSPSPALPRLVSASLGLALAHSVSGSLCVSLSLIRLVWLALAHLVWLSLVLTMARLISRSVSCSLIACVYVSHAFSLCRYPSPRASGILPT
uniref:Death effector domain-containing protein n=1 Tax=Callorhinchus milii TaxID=7868 RepID=A0A4W3HKJ6_CALMI